MNLIQDLEIKPGTRVLLRCDLNLPQDDSGNFTDFFRLESSLPTIEYLQDLEATVFITAHLGSPKGKKDPSLSLAPIAPILQDQLGQKVEFIEDPFDASIDLKSQKGIYLVENLRFWPGEESADLEFAKSLVDATGAEVFIQDAFGVVHRDHASLTCFPQLLASAAGILLQKEIQYLSEPSIENLTLIVGGAKVESKLPVISNFVDKADYVLTGGVVANTFLKSTGQDIASSLFEETCLTQAKQIIEDSQTSKTEIMLPVDYLSATAPDALMAEESSADNLQKNQLILDLGNQTIQKYKDRLEASRTVIWAGTLGFAENPVFAESSKQILQYLLGLKGINSDLKIIIGGGDTVDFTRGALSQDDLKQITHLSTGGGASLLMLSGQQLPGIKALDTVPGSIHSKPSNNKKVETLEDKSNPSSPLAIKAPILIANLKSHFNLHEAKLWLSEVLSSEVLTSTLLQLSIAPPSIFIEELHSIISASRSVNPPSVIAQDISEHKEGSETGQIAATQLKGIASGSLIGHSERRKIYHESNQSIANKAYQAMAADLNVILCVGGESKQSVAHSKEVADQLESTIVGLNSLTSRCLIIAYEPVFAIGSGQTPEEDFLSKQLSSIRDVLYDYGLECKVLYGGSVDQGNAKAILALGFDGLLVGSASLIPKTLEAIGINITA